VAPPLIIAIFAAVVALPALAQHHGHTPYSGMERREIKTLSEADIADLRRGAGWGLALSAELNGVPGPAHLLELKDRLGLSPAQIASLEAIFLDMQTEARAAGETFIAAEAAIETAFRQGNLTEGRLRNLLAAAAEARANLRFIHLSRHLQTPGLLTADEIARYNELRGYSAADPCKNIPQGHDPAMWRRHNNCR
jgi:hypothetical protein